MKKIFAPQGCAASPAIVNPAVLAVGIVIMLVTGCGQRLTGPAAVPPRAVTRVQPPDWFHQQLAAARAARRAHQPKTDTAGAQLAYDNVMRTACTQAALAGPGKYPVHCNTILHPMPTQSSVDPCDGTADDPAAEIACND